MYKKQKHFFLHEHYSYYCKKRAIFALERNTPGIVPESSLCSLLMYIKKKFTVLILEKIK